MINKKLLSLYIHIPFCVRKCYYCDFLSSPADDMMKKKYVQALLTEIKVRASEYREYVIDTVFFGGGTPSVMERDDFLRILEALKEHFQILSDAEISMELNPGTVDYEKLSGYRKAGINRISIGLQSTNNEELKKIGRIHTYEDFLQSYQEARNVGYDNINIDVMSGLPGQSLSSYLSTLEKVVILKPQHISSYSLIIEEGTPFAKMKLELPDEDTERKMYQKTDEIFRSNGYHRYEISNYAMQGYECRHNVGYWTGHEYLGLGLGAASFIKNRRFHNETDLMLYIEERNHEKMLSETFKRDEEMIQRESQMEEFMFLGLRLMSGISYETFKEKFGCDIKEVYGDTILKLIKDGLLLEDKCGHLKLTVRGIDISNYVMSEFLF